MGSTDDSWKDAVRRKVMNMFPGNNYDDAARILFALDLEEKEYKNLNKSSPTWITLNFALDESNDGMYKAYGQRILDDSKKESINTQYGEALHKLKDNMSKGNELSPSWNIFSEEVQQGYDLVRFNSACVASGFVGFARAMSLLSPAAQREIIQQIPRILDQSVVAWAGQLTGYVSRYGGAVVTVALAAISLSWEAIRSIRLWWKGEISGVRCCKNIVDSAASIGGGIAGGLGGAAIGSLAGPIGTVVGGVIGAVITAELVNALSDRLTQKIFGVPQSVALENAYNYFGVGMSASNSEINSAYRERCRMYHPDKGGNGVEFEIVQVHMATIKAARGDL